MIEVIATDEFAAWYADLVSWNRSSHRHCEERSDEAIPRDLDCFAALAMTGARL